MSEIRIQGQESLAALGRDLHTAGGGTLRRELEQEIDGIGRDLLAAVRSAAPAIVRPSLGMRSELTADEVVITIEADPAKMPPGKQMLPRLLEGPGPWRHPVFGGPGWAIQQPRPYLAPTLQARSPQVERAVIAAIDATAAKVEGGR